MYLRAPVLYGCKCTANKQLRSEDQEGWEALQMGKWALAEM